MGSLKIKLNPFTGRFDLVNKKAKNASDTVVFYRNCNVYEDTWLNVNSTVSNQNGSKVKSEDLQISKVCIRNKRNISFDVELYEHDGGLVNSSLLTTLNVTSNDDSFAPNLAITEGKQLAARVVNFSTDRPAQIKVEVLIEGL